MGVPFNLTEPEFRAGGAEGAEEGRGDESLKRENRAERVYLTVTLKHKDCHCIKAP